MTFLTVVGASVLAAVAVVSGYEYAVHPPSNDPSPVIGLLLVAAVVALPYAFLLLLRLGPAG
jgi:hypothetical protein